MELCEKYLYELLDLNPPLGDFFLIQYTDDYQPNTFLKKYSNTESHIINKYMDLLHRKKVKSNLDILLQYEFNDINNSIEFDENLIPLNLSDNIFILYIQQCTGNYGYSFITDKDYIKFINRLKALPDITKSIIFHLNKGIHENITHPKIIVIRLVHYLHNIIRYKSYTHKKKHKYTNRLNNAIERYLTTSINKILQYLETKYILHARESIGYCNIPNGKQYYIDLLKYYTLPTFTPHKVVSIANDQLPKTLKKINNIKKQINYKGTYKEFIQYILNKKSHKIRTKSELNKHIKEINSKIQNNVMEKYFLNNKNISIKYKVRYISNIEPLYSPYFIQHHKNSIGTITINSDQQTPIDKYELYILLLHEGNPGHNYECINNHTFNSDYLLFTNYPGYSEGWAFYCEQLYETDNPYINLYKYIYELHRIIRLYIDTGIHYYNWDISKCILFMEKYCFMKRGDIVDEILRYISTPAQALTYYIGRSIFIEYRDKYLSTFTNGIQGYHELILNIGPCPLSILKDRLDEQIHSK